MSAEEIAREDYITRVVDAAPPLSQAQLAKLHGLFDYEGTADRPGEPPGQRKRPHRVAAGAVSKSTAADHPQATP